MPDSIDVNDPAYRQAVSEFKSDADAFSAIKVAHSIASEYAKSGSATPEGIVALHRDVYFLYKHGMPFAEYIVSISKKP